MKNNSKHSILLIEPDPEDQEFFMFTLHDQFEDIPCYAVSNAEEAVDLLNKGKVNPTLIFLESNLPAQDGYDFVKVNRKKSYSENAKYIIYTSRYSEAEKQHAKSAGATAIYSKARTSALKEILQKYLAKEILPSEYHIS